MMRPPFVDVQVHVPYCKLPADADHCFQAQLGKIDQNSITGIRHEVVALVAAC